MKRRILCVLLALVLCVALLPVTAGAANETVKWLDISAGAINISPDGYTVGSAGMTAYTGKYGLFQREGRAYTVCFEPGGTYDVTLKGLHVTGEGLQNPVIWVSGNSVVNLTLDGDNLLDTRSAYLVDCTAVTTFSGSTLNITGNGTLTTISSYWPSILTHGACRINISGENTAVKAYGMQYNSTASLPPAIREYDSDTASGDANLQLSVTDGATLEAYAGNPAGTSRKRPAPLQTFRPPRSGRRHGTTRIRRWIAKRSNTAATAESTSIIMCHSRAPYPCCTARPKIRAVPRSKS